MSEKVVIKVEDLHKDFQVGQQQVSILKGITFDIRQGDFLIIVGPSGCGKSTLLNIILGLETPTQGKVNFFDNDFFANTNEDDRAGIRKKIAGLVYQQANWVKSFNVIENVYFPLTLLGRKEEECFNKAISSLDKVNMADWAEYSPSELSSGQQQRVSMARAIVHNPDLIVADEPTGNLDFSSGEGVMQLLHDLCKKEKKTVIMVTHDLEYVKYANSVIQLLDGVVVKKFNDTNKEEIIKSMTLKKGLSKK